MQFEYEISAEEFAAGQVLYERLQPGRNYVRTAIVWIAGGLAFLLLAWHESLSIAARIFMVGIGVWWIYCGFVQLYPHRHFRKHYAESGLPGQKFLADVGADGLRVKSDLREWRVAWQGVTFKAQDELVIILYSAGTIFIFARKYLDEQQQAELCQISGLNAPAAKARVITQ